ncbi:beta-1,4 N-acetylgalactosaminyltransferase 1-like [Salarias fasciatus]|uniref:beta-1,4 N-acetylgalactosaminyltransferase 1-like n=1 Tax=Salarias fasciatus TaxID=181472 RepID=UPI001176BA84|nr:beta-1,4 N-acetylgalactosaminyltransferase 1-like [Salarias fasciatus]
MVITNPGAFAIIDSPHDKPSSCNCSRGSVFLKNRIPQNIYKDLEQRRTKEFKEYKARRTSVLSNLLYALPNSPLQYPIQGFIVQPLRATIIPGLELHAGKRDSYKVSLKVSIGVLSTVDLGEGAIVTGVGERELTIESSSLVTLNDLLASVSYRSTVYHINTGDLASFHFEDHKAVFPIAIKQSEIPVLWDMGTDINSQVSIAMKAFLRYSKVRVLVDSIRRFYPKMKIIIADDSPVNEKITGENIEHYLMPPAKGFFAGRNLAVSQVTTKYFLWVDDDFSFTKNTQIEKFVEVMEANPELDLVGGSVKGNRFYFTIVREEGDEAEGDCVYKRSGGKFHSVPGYPQCHLVSGVVNFFLARTESVRKVGFDPMLRRVAHSEFFLDGLGSLMVATCNDRSAMHINHQSKKGQSHSYLRFRHPGKKDRNLKLRRLFFKNHIKCFRL